MTDFFRKKRKLKTHCGQGIGSEHRFRCTLHFCFCLQLSAKQKLCLSSNTEGGLYFRETQQCQLKYLSHGETRQEKPGRAHSWKCFAMLRAYRTNVRRSTLAAGRTTNWGGSVWKNRLKYENWKQLFCLKFSCESSSFSWHAHALQSKVCWEIPS